MPAYTEESVTNCKRKSDLCLLVDFPSRMVKICPCISGRTDERDSGECCQPLTEMYRSRYGQIYCKCRHVNIESGERELDSNLVLGTEHSNGHNCQADVGAVRNHQ